MPRQRLLRFGLFVSAVLVLMCSQSFGEQPRAYRDRVDPHWFAGGNKFWYRNDTAAGNWEFVLVDANAGTREPAFDHARVAAGLSKLTGTQYAAQSLPIDSLLFSEDEKSVCLFGQDHAWN